MYIFGKIYTNNRIYESIYWIYSQFTEIQSKQANLPKYAQSVFFGFLLKKTSLVQPNVHNSMAIKNNKVYFGKSSFLQRKNTKFFCCYKLWATLAKKNIRAWNYLGIYKFSLGSLGIFVRINCERWSFIAFYYLLTAAPSMDGS